jgi:hypothetical protein
MALAHGVSIFWEDDGIPPAKYRGSGHEKTTHVASASTSEISNTLPRDAVFMSARENHNPAFMRKPNAETTCSGTGE